MKYSIKEDKEESVFKVFSVGCAVDYVYITMSDEFVIAITTKDKLGIYRYGFKHNPDRAPLIIDINGKFIEEQ